MYDVKPGQLVEVDWIDPSGDFCWVNSEKIVDLPKMPCHSIGWIHLVNDDGIVLIACYCDMANKERDILIRQNLPWGCITDIWIIG